MAAYLGAAIKRRLYPTVSCYHGCVSGRAEVLTFRSAVDDIKGHVRQLQNAGYRFLLPSEYKAWQQGLVSYDQPVTCIHFDDCLGSIDLIVPWLIEQQIPFGLAIITRRLGTYDAEDGFSRWSLLRTWLDSGLMQVMSHTHNLHHLAVLPQPGGGVDVAPVLEGPVWVDAGDVVYRAAGDTRWYWEFSHVDTITLGVPLFGTSPYDGTTLVTTTLTITPKTTGSVAVLRLWMALSKPSGGGYPAQVQIRAASVLVWSGTITPKNYETRSQWVEREFYSITLDASFAVVSGVAFALEFRTLNAGEGVAVLYGLPTRSDTAFRAVTNCNGLFLAGSQEAPNRFWQYIDYPAGDRWPVIPCLILGFGTGAAATVAEYQGYVAADCAAFTGAVNSYLRATWAESALWTATALYYRPLTLNFSTTPGNGLRVYGDYKPFGWDNPTRVETVVPLLSAAAASIEWLRLTLTRPESFIGGDADPFGDDAYLLPQEMAQIAEAENRSYSAAFALYIGDTDAGPWVHVGDTAIFRIRAGVCDVTPIALAAGVPRWLRIEPINGGPTFGTETRTRWGLKSVTGGVRTPTAYAGALDQIVYPFGSYFNSGVGAIQQRPGFEDISANLKSVFASAGLTHGYTIQSIRNVAVPEFREPELRQTEWALGRWLVYGDQAPAVSQNNLAAYSGTLFPDVPHRGVVWQASLEADPLGNASVRSRAQVLDYVAFDAWGFNGSGAIVPAAINDGGTYDSTVYADDKAWLQARGVRCLLIINNNLGTGEPDPVIGAHVVNNAGTYIPLIVAIAVNDGWDGITCNLEAVPSANRAAATAFYVALARAMHAAGKLLHATVPAATGTAYDADFWTGWCDHLAIVRVCDAIKVMSYTETGPGTAPGPAAPQVFWDLVYGYMRAVVPEMYWPRILCGCRSFGHLWDVPAGTASYISYHRGIADALTYGKRIDIQDTEAGWGTDTLKAWFGTPLTVDRAQREAVAAPFGGIGLWKLDDGDIEEFIPATRQIGRVEDMSALDIVFPEDISYGSSGGPRFSTSIVATQSGDEARNGRWLAPLHAYDASLAVRTQAQLDTVRSIFMVAGGRRDSFKFKDWSDFKLDAQVIGTADGVITTFQIVKTYASGAESLTRTISKPKAAGLRIFRNGTEVFTGWTVNATTGLVSFTVPPAAGVISATGQFWVPVRFDTDALPSEVIARFGDSQHLFSPGTIPLMEVRR